VLALTVGFVAGAAGGLEVAATALLACLLVGIAVLVPLRFEASLCVLAFTFALDQLFYKFAETRYNLLGYVAAYVLLVGGRTMRARLTATEILALAWIGWSGITMLWTPDVESASGILVTMVCSLVILRLFSVGIADETLVHQTAGFFLAGTIVMGAVTLQGYASGDMVWQELNQRYVVGALGILEEYSPVQLARDFGVAMLFGLFLFDLPQLPAYRRAVAFAAACFSGILLVLTVNRGIILAESLALLVWVITVTPKRLPARLVPLLGAVATAAVVAYATNPDVIELRFAATQSHYEAGEMRQLTSGRSAIWAVGVDMFLEHPAVGTGLASFEEYYRDLSGDGERAAHNSYLSAATETGIIGLLLFIGFMVSLGLRAWHAGENRSTALACWLLFALGIGFAGLGTARPFWMSAGLVLFWNARATEQRDADARARAERFIARLAGRRKVPATVSAFGGR